MHDVTPLRARVAAGDVSANVTLAYMILCQREPGTIPEALSLVQQACAQNQTAALMLHSVLAARGIGRPKKITDAYAYMKQAAALGDRLAQEQIAILGATVLNNEPWTKPITLVPHAEAPRIFSIEGFLPANVCAWLTKSAAPKLEAAKILDPGGGGQLALMRTNMTAAFNILQPDLILQLVTRRIATATGTPMANHEPINILRYSPGQEYKPHFDFVRPWTAEVEGHADELARLGQRCATLLVYLNEDYEGGETVFPRLDLKFKGKTGDALIFWNISQSGELERDSLHAGAPVVSGEKWLLSQWIREKAHPLI